ncbi:CoA-binding domain protein [Bordetella bronchiseptica M85/00/2]|nr:CoA-binding domain protein [Bordetella bronchiseptica M85/00/2]
MTLPYAIRRLFVDLPRPFKQMLAIVLDAVILLGAFHLALWLRFELFFLTDQYLFLSLLACAGGIAALAAFGVYLYILRYMSERVLAAILGGIVVSVMVVTAGNTFLQLATISRGVLVLYAALALVGLIGVRLIARKLLFPADHHMADPRTPVLIYGAGGAGSQLAMALRAGPHYRPVAMLDDDKRKHRLVVNGLRVYPPEQLPKLIDRHNIRQLLIAMPSAPPKQIRSIVEAAEPYRLRIRLVPSMRELIDPTNGVRLRDVQVEDLLGRDPVAPIDTLLGRCVTDRVVMVTGAGGSIGSELCRQILALRPRKLVLFEIAEPALYAIEQDLRQRIGERNIEIAGVLGSVRDAAHCLAQLQEHGVQTIYHAAAYKHVPIVEHNVSEGIRTNAFGTLNMAETAIQAGVLDFVLISTDKAVRPTNVMGASKRLAELILQAHAQIQDKTRLLDGALWQRAGQLRQRRSAVPAPDPRRRADHAHASRDHALLHDHTRSRATGTAGRCHGRIRLGLRAGHGRTGIDPRTGRAHGAPVRTDGKELGPAGWRYRNSHHGTAARGKTVRRTADRGRLP